MSTPSVIDLRPYQDDCIKSLVDYRRHPAQGGVGARALVAMPTGCGKTIIFAQLPTLAKKRTLVIAHREELLDQAAYHLAVANPGKAVGIEQAGRRAGAADIVVASIQSLASGGGERLRRLDPQEFSLVIVDEAHHSTARTYVETLHHFGLAPSVADLRHSDLGRKKLRAEAETRFSDYRPDKDGPFLVGFTATPHRTDGQGLEAIYDQIAYSATIEEMIGAGWLCPVRGKLVHTGHDISDVKTYMGDYQESQLSDAVNTPERNNLAVAAYQEHAAGRQAIIFCVDVEHTRDMAAAWNTAGVATGVVTGDTPTDERRATLAAYKAGELTALSNCMVLTEGYDSPETACIVMARPTRSGLVYTQAMGRGTRISPGKTDLLVLDLVDLAAKGVAIQSANTLFGLPPKLALGDKDVLEVKDEIARRAEGTLPLFMLDDIEDLSEIDMLVRDFNPLLAGRHDPLLSGAKLTWVSTSYGYTCSLMGEGQLAVVVDLLGQATVRFQKVGAVTEPLGEFQGVAAAIAWAEGWAGNEAPDVMHAARKNARWHQDAPTQKQLNILKYLAVKPLPEGLTKGWASALIEQAKEKPENQRRVRAWQG